MLRQFMKGIPLEYKDTFDTITEGSIPQIHMGM